MAHQRVANRYLKNSPPCANVSHELEAQLSALDDSHKRTLTNLSDTDEARIGQIVQLKAQRELITSLTNENEQLQSLYEEACEERDTAVESKNFYASQVAELEAATPRWNWVAGSGLQHKGRQGIPRHW